MPWVFPQVQKLYLATGNDRLKLLVLYSGEEDERLRKAAAGTLAMLTAEQPELCTRIPGTVSTHPSAQHTNIIRWFFFFFFPLYLVSLLSSLLSDDPLDGDRAGAVAQWNNWPPSSRSSHHSEHDAGGQASSWDPNGERSSWDSFFLGKERRGYTRSCFKGSSELSWQGCGVWHHQDKGRERKEQRKWTLKTPQQHADVPPDFMRAAKGFKYYVGPVKSFHFCRILVLGLMTLHRISGRKWTEYKLILKHSCVLKLQILWCSSLLAICVLTSSTM